MPFKSGQSGNPAGRRAEKPFADALRMELAAAGTDHKALRKVAATLIAKAQDGDMSAIKELADRLDGKAVQGIEADVSMSYEDRLQQLFKERDQ
jgi:ribosomal protein L17